jgi:hypothetical protein
LPAFIGFRTGSIFANPVLNAKFQDGTCAPLSSLMDLADGSKECAMKLDARRSNENRRGSEQVAQRAQATLNAHAHFRGRAGRFEFDFHEDVLIVRGTVPTFYLKQILQCALKDIDGVRLIDNQVQVVSAAGLSSIGNC